MSRSSFNVTFKAGTYYLSGVVDEFADLMPHLQNAQPPLRLNLSGITRMNSIGIRNFLLFLKTWGNQPLFYEACTVEFINQLALIPGLRGLPAPVAVVESLYVPYQCTSCHEFTDRLTNFTAVSKDSSGNLLFPQVFCPACQAEMAVDPEHYGFFLASA